ncbi:MAG: hypothetical protein NZ992_04950 [Candidatus Korarchaeum sp.]|nr:hypothetical protein [Candidatus Korarchaeum sp.]MDW8035366.1 hypothetical protein [Candidatus Korarchaeum sp.]
MKVIERIEMRKENYRCAYVPLIKLTKLLSSMRKGEAIEVLIDTERFSLDSVESLAKVYGAVCERISCRDNFIELLIKK